MVRFLCETCFDECARLEAPSAARERSVILDVPLNFGHATGCVVVPPNYFGLGYILEAAPVKGLSYAEAMPRGFSAEPIHVVTQLPRGTAVCPRFVVKHALLRKSPFQVCERRAPRRGIDAALEP